MAEPMAPAISLHSAVALAGRFPVLAGVDLDLDQGSISVILGANGAGKTSLLRLLAGLLPLTSGSGTVLGCELPASAADLRRQVGMLGHDVGLFDELTPLENYRFALKAARLNAASAEAALERVGITGRLATTSLGLLSEGQRRRVGLGLLAARRPALWLLDEPHAGLDSTTRVIVNELCEEAANAGATVVASSHEPELSVPMADHVVTMSGGVVTSLHAGGRTGGASHVA